MDFSSHLNAAMTAAEVAGVEILKVYESGNFQIENKDAEGTNNPVGLADKLANSVICDRLHSKFPDFGILSEEAVTPSSWRNYPDLMVQAFKEWKEREYTWVVDPLDGTKEFIKENGEFGVHIGLTENGVPMVGVNYYPVQGMFYFGVKGEGAYKLGGPLSQINVSNVSDVKDMKLVISKSNPDEDLRGFISDNGLKEPVAVGSAGYKICFVADGSADFYFLAKPNMNLWGCCSGQVILEEAGGKVTDCDGKPIDYRSDDIILNRGFVASNARNHEGIVRLVNSHFF